MMRALGRIHNDLQVVFCFRHATPSHYHHDAGLLTGVEHMGIYYRGSLDYLSCNTWVEPFKLWHAGRPMTDMYSAF